MVCVGRIVKGRDDLLDRPIFRIIVILSETKNLGYRDANSARPILPDFVIASAVSRNSAIQYIHLHHSEWNEALKDTLASLTKSIFTKTGSFVVSPQDDVIVKHEAIQYITFSNKFKAPG